MNDIRLREDASHPAITTSTPCIKIDDGIPLPDRGDGRAGRYGGTGITAALRALEVGQSFVLPNPRDLPLGRIQSDACHSIRKLRPSKFVTRKVFENGERVARVWRTA